MTNTPLNKRVIVSLCDYSGNWSDPYRRAGYTVIQVDLKHGHDARLLKKFSHPVHGILCAPVCTAFSGAGAKHWAAKAVDGNKQLLEGLALVDACLRIVHANKPRWWVLENPVGRLKDYIGYHRHTFNPNEYAGYLGDALTGAMVEKPSVKTLDTMGEEQKRWWTQQNNEIEEQGWMTDAYTKRTCLWGHFGIPENSERLAIWGSKMWSSYGGKSERTKEMRSMTPKGFAEAFFLSNP